MGGRRALLEQEESIGGMLKTIRSLAGNEGDAVVGTAVFKEYSGNEVPW